MRVSSKVPAAFKQVPVVEYLATRFTYRPFSDWLELVENGRVFCNGIPCQMATLVTQGDIVTCELPEVAPQPANFDYTIVHEDEWLLGINKPGNLRVHDKGKFVTANLMYHLREHHQPPYPEAQLINRLDKDTSGVVLVAKNTAVVKLMSQQFREQAVEKTYVAVVQGIPEQPQGVIDLPIGKVKEAKVPRYGVERRPTTDGQPPPGLNASSGLYPVENARPAVTTYEVIWPFSAHTLLKLRPQTGRTHQIRVHLAAIGHPIVGDALYTMSDDEFLAWCAQKTETAEWHGITRQALHCQQNSFTHPMTNLPITIEAPLPADIIHLLARLEYLERET